ncbi:uncharacterized protein LOC124162616 [Ischnura elegans]|uniref:uncharacterized protein LOC124162616 n=1 Tax=Ischnura elegans TaxID=197161 RepID=UPI001ED896F9|nr:uncharacterized protein LOC124162616 [Ischnura elegans]
MLTMLVGSNVLIKYLLKSTYYIPRQANTNFEGAKPPKEKLYDKYTTLLKKLRKSGLRINRGESTYVDIPEVELGLSDSSSSVGGDLSWLMRCTEPVEEAAERWRNTSAARLHDLRTTEPRKQGCQKNIHLVTNYFDTYPVLRQPWAFSLLLIDYKNLYQETELALIEHWPSIALKIKLMSNVNPIHVESIEDTVNTLSLIPKLFGPTTVGKWKTTAVDSKNGFLLHVTTNAALETEVNRIRAKLEAAKRTLQPFPIVVGADEANITDCYVYIDTFFYSVESPLRAIDV